MHFFEIFHRSIITDKRLELPKEFTVKYGQKLSESAIIKVPNGIWRIGMRKAEGLISFENGWSEFMEFYSIYVGHVILFRYDGNSKFQVHIFGIDSTEIDYPSHNVNTNYVAEITSTHSHKGEVEVVSIHSDSSQSDDEPSMSSESPLNLKPEPARQEFPQKSRKRKTAIPRTFHNKALQATVEAVEGFKPGNPFFKVTLHASYIKGPLRVPNAFANSYWRNVTQRGITLRISDGRTWEVRYVPGTQYNRMLSQGWYKFVADNHLKEGDICVFELVNREKLEMNVRIFDQQKTFARKVTPKIDQLPEFQATLKAAEEFTSENPLFKVVMHKSYIKKGLVRVPAVFATSHLRNITETAKITLTGSDGRTWEVKYVSSSPNHRRISHGWGKFVADNELKEGDICVFELLNHGDLLEMNELPNEFTEKYVTELSDLASMKVLNSIWHIGLKRAEGVIFFENGWPEFMEFYSICVGHAMFFRYDGNSEFQVYIFGKDATEIDYPSHIDNTNHDAEMTSTHSDEDEVEAVSTHSNYEPSMSNESSLNSESTQSNYEPPVSSKSSLDSGSSQSNYEPSMSNESSSGQRVEPARQEFSQKTRKQRTLFRTRIHTKEFQKTIEAAEAFKPENPTFKCILQSSHINKILKVPISFVRLYLKNIARMVISLRISDGRTWKVGYASRTHAGRLESKLSKGWYKFVADNHLKEGDVCVFELVDRKNIEMIVHIFQQQKTFARKVNPKIRYYTTEFQATLEAAKEFTSENPSFKVVMQASYVERQLRVPAVFANLHLRNITETVITLMVSDGRTWKVRYFSRPPANKMLSHGWSKFVVDNDLKEGDVCVFELVDRENIEMIVHIFGQQKPSVRKLTPKSSNYTAEFLSTLETAEKFTSENPFFKVIMLSAHIKRGNVRIPAAFGTQHLMDITRTAITLRVSDEKTWEVGYVSPTPTERRISRGWREFVADNDLKEGDVCVFELVDFKKKLEMNVHIFRLVQDSIE